MKAWEYDAGSLNINGNLLDTLHINSNLEKYLETGQHDHKFVLIGPKGIGKTLFINLKSYIYNEELQEKGFKIYPVNQLVENIKITNSLLSKDDILKFSSFEMWKNIWLFSLSVVILETVGIEINKELSELLGDDNHSISNIITTLLLDRKKVSHYLKYNNELLSKIETIQNGVALFLDNVDQGFRSFLTEYHHTDDQILNPAITVWTNTQNALLATIYDINRKNSHIKIFSTIRSEAFNAYKGEMKLNFKNYCTEIHYSKSEIKKIFEINIELTEKKYLAKPSATNTCEKFFGFTKMSHPFAKHKNNRKKIENVFDFIYRHSLGRPREVIYMGNVLLNKLIQNEEYKKMKSNGKIEKVRWSVNDISDDLLKNQYFNEIIPKFKKDELYKLLNIVQSNVIPAIFVNKGLSEIIKYLYSLGLLGYIKKKNHDKKSKNLYTQIFLPVAHYSYNSEIDLPKSKYYLTHPAMDGILKDLFDLNFYNNANIIGNGYDFIDTKYMTRTYDIALSFAGEDREYVEKVATILKDNGISVFYDNHHKTSLWGKDLFQHLTVIYKELAKHCAIFISKHYPIKLWTQHELKAAQARSLEEEYEYILPIRFDDTKIPGLNNTIGYLNASKLTEDELAKEIMKKIKNNA